MKIEKTDHVLVKELADFGERVKYLLEQLRLRQKEIAPGWDDGKRGKIGR